MVAAKAVLLHATALAGLRFGTRRTLAQMSPFDLITAAAMGAVIGRTSTSSGTSYAAGAVAVVTLIAVHRLVSLLRYQPAVRRCWCSGWPGTAAAVRVVDHCAGCWDVTLNVEHPQRGPWSGSRRLAYHSRRTASSPPQPDTHLCRRLTSPKAPPWRPQSER